MSVTFTELLWLFLIYSFIGWFIEAMVGTVKNRKFTNRGFTSGTFCPVYGIAASVMTVTLSDLIGNPVFLFIGCAIEATAVEWITGKFLERLDRRKWWDYSEKKWNFDGYICLQYTLLWGVLGFTAMCYCNTFFLFLYNLIPHLPGLIVVWFFIIYILLDLSLSLATVLHSRKTESVPHKMSFLYRAAGSAISFAEKRMEKAYPSIRKRAEKINREGKFAEGCGFYKLFWLFFISAFLGDVAETLYCRLVSGEWMSRSSLVWGPFSVVWGFAIVFATVLLYKDRDRQDRHIFLTGFFLGGAYEYVCSVLSELVFGRVFWDYSNMPFNLGGRVNLLYCFFWGFAAVVWIKGLYPHLSKWIEKIPKLAGYIASWILIVFMTADMLISAAALIRYDERDGGAAATGGWEQIIDTNFDDEEMEEIYPNAMEK